MKESETFASWMKAMKLSRAEAITRLGTGSPSTVGRYLAGRVPDTRTLRRMMRVGLEVDEDRCLTWLGRWLEEDEDAPTKAKSTDGKKHKERAQREENPLLRAARGR